MLPVTLEWARYVEGYRIESYARYGKVVVGNGRQLVACEPTKGNDLLYAEFAGIRDADDLLAFVNRHGYLERIRSMGGTAIDIKTFRPLDDGHPGETVKTHLESAKLIRRVIRAENQESVGSRKAAYAELEYIYDQEDLGHIRLVSKPDSSGFQTAFIASSLMNAIWLQLGRRIGGGIKWGECRYCGGWFEKGPGTDKRMDSQFCTPSHKVAFHRKSRGG